MKIRASILAVGALWLIPTGARASETYPAAVQEALDLACAPPCVLCHTRPEGGLNYVNSGFGSRVKATRIGVKHPERIPAALACIELGATASGNPDCPFETPPDTDGDGKPDVQELRNAESPNTADSLNLCGPSYGCGARIEPRSELDGPAALTAVTILLVLFWVMRRRTI